jgi:hypothetical protein
MRKLDAIAAIPGSESWFGAAKHKFRMREPMPEAELIAFERKHGVVLPEDYREFLLRAGDGGAGPFYGIEPLSEWDHWFEEEGEVAGFLASPCPLVDCEDLRLAWHAAKMRDARRAEGIVRAGASPSSCWAPFVAPDWPGWGRGTINLCDQGCTYSARLIVSGQARGRVIYLDAQLWYPPYFVKDPSFLDWYERWLEEALEGEPPAWFGFENQDYR